MVSLIGPSGKSTLMNILGLLDRPTSGAAASSVSYMIAADTLELSGSNAVGQILTSATGAHSVERAKDAITSQIKSAHVGQNDFTVET